MITRRLLCTISPKTSALWTKFSAVGQPIYVLEPDLDFEHRFADLEKLAAVYKAREMEPPDLHKLRDAYWNWKNIFAKYQVTENQDKRKEIAAKLVELNWVPIECLAIPNDLLERDEVQISEIPETDTEVQKSHMEILEGQNLISRHSNPSNFVLLGAAAELQRSIENYVTDFFSKAGFHLCTAPNLVRQAVIEGCGMKDLKFPSVKDNAAQKPSAKHLVGQGLPSLVSIVAKKNLTKNNDWPLLLYSSGASYSGASGVDLYSTPQRLTANCLALSVNLEESRRVRRHLMSLLSKCLSELAIPHRAQPLPAPTLELSQLNALAIQSAGRQLAYLTEHGDYISRRLRITREKEYLLSVFAGINLSALLARVLELHGLAPLCPGRN